MISSRLMNVPKVHKPSPIKHVRKSDFTHTFKGTLAGICVLCVAIVNLALFFNLESRYSDLQKFPHKRPFIQ